MTRSLVAQRLASQLLAGPPATTVVDAVHRLLAVQAQDPRGTRLAIRARTANLTVHDIDRALTHDRSVIVTWLNRGTLHLVPAVDYWWLHPLTTPQLVTNSERRLREEGVTPAQAKKGIAVIEQAVAEAPQTRDDLRRRLDAAKVPTARQALVHVIAAASIHGDLIRGPMVDGHHAFVSAAQWLGPPPPPLERDEALARLARRYLGGHAPGAAEDLAKWAGITLGDARRAFAALGTHADAGPPPKLPPPRLLGPFDPLLHGWASREMFVGAHRNVVTTNGLFRATALVNGRVVATWGLSGNVLTIRPLEAITARALTALRRDALDVARFLDVTLDTVVA